MGILKSRKHPLSIRKIKYTMRYANKECQKEITKLNNSEELCSCPKCKSNKHVAYAGTNKGMRKFACNNPDYKKPVCFSTSTSYEAIEIYRDTMTKNLCQLLKANSVVEGIRELNGTSKYFIELPLERLYQFICKQTNQPSIKIDDNTNIATIFLDFSGSGLARNKAIILAKINNKTIFEVVTTSNHLSAHKLLATIKDKLRLSKKTKLVFITDGEECFVDSIRHFFPEAIHIRQFHKKSCKGIIYIHLKYRRKEYTVRCLWDSVLNEEEPSKEVVRMREQRAKKRLLDKERKRNVRYSDLSKEVMVWRGVVYKPRGIRRRLPEKKAKKESETVASPKKNTSPLGVPELIFKGELEEAKKLSVFKYCFKILKRIFGGLYITSNIVENVFNIKTKLKPHRTMKFGERILVCILYGSFILKDMSKEEIINFLKENIITYDFIKQKVLYGSGLQKNKLKELSFLDVIKKAIKEKKKLVLHYCDRYRRHTSRIIVPLRIRANKYTNTTQVESFCELRKAKRIFYLERMRDVVIFDPKPICF